MTGYQVRPGPGGTRLSGHSIPFEGKPMRRLLGGGNRGIRMDADSGPGRTRCI